MVKSLGLNVVPTGIQTQTESPSRCSPNLNLTANFLFSRQLGGNQVQSGNMSGSGSSGGKNVPTQISSRGTENKKKKRKHDLESLFIHSAISL